MSTQFWSEDGYGIDVEGLVIDPKTIKEFVLKHYKSFDENLLKEVELNPTSDEKDFEEVFANFEDDYGQTSFFTFVAEVMKAETDIDFGFCKGTDYGETIMVFPRYVWSVISEKEKNTTRDDLDKIFMA